MKFIRNIKLSSLLRYFYAPIPIIAAVWVARAVLTAHFGHKLWFLLAALALSYLPLKSFLIGCVLMYKAYAPLSLRDKCRFEPTCSTYMMLAIQKYGIIIGVAKGLNRLWRCKPPNGGIDYP